MLSGSFKFWMAFAVIMTRVAVKVVDSGDGGVGGNNGDGSAGAGGDDGAWMMMVSV